MSAKHTPGPWIANRRDPQEWQIDAPNGDPNLLHARWHGMAVVYGCDDLGRAGEQVAEANARLIAAAPDLLAALERMTELAEGPTGGVSQQQKRDVIANARAVLAKAKGDA